MKKVYVYQILDEVSEGVISTFIGPNDVFANRQFKAFINDPKIKESIVPGDFFLVKSLPVDVFESCKDFYDYVGKDDLFVSYGTQVFCGDVEVSDET